MKRFKKILCVVDALAGPSPALQRAATLTNKNDAELKVIDVVDDASGWFGLLQSHQAELIQDRTDRLQQLVAPLSSQNTSISVELIRGRPAIEATREVLRHGFDLVIKDGRGTSKHPTRLISSVDMRLLRNCPCPVWLNAPDHDLSHKTILAAVDPLAADAEHKSMNRTILELGSSLAESGAAELHVISAWEAEGEALLAGRVSRERLLEYVADAHKASEQGLARTLARVQPHFDTDQVHLRRGEAANVILACAREIRCDLLVMGTVARGIPGLLMGNCADMVVQQIECSVLTVKPDGFVSPVKRV